MTNSKESILIKRLIVSVIILIVLMYFSMGHLLPDLKVSALFDASPLALGLLQMLLCFFALFVNEDNFKTALKELFDKTPGIYTLPVIGSVILFVYSVFVIVLMLTSSYNGDNDKVSFLLGELLFNSSVLIITLVDAGLIILNKIQDKALSSINRLKSLVPTSATIIDHYDKQKIIPVKNLKKGDVFVVLPDEVVPVDGVVVEGNSSIDESFLTGEKVPVDKRIGSRVFASTVNTYGFIKCRTVLTGDETSISRTIKLAQDNLDTRIPAFDYSKKTMKMLVIFSLISSVLTFILWYFHGESISLSMSRAVSVLCVSCPGALCFLTSLSVMIKSGDALKDGIVFRNSDALEKLWLSEIVAINKTGTVTKGEPVVMDVFTPDSITRSGYSLINNSENELLKIAGLLEKKSHHPLAKAVVDYVGDINNYIDDIYDEDEEEEEITDFEALPGHGLKGMYRGHQVVGASLKYISGIVRLIPEVRDKAVGLATQGKTPLCFSMDKKLLGIIAVSDAVKEDSIKAINELKELDIHVVMLTGDNERTAMAIGDQAGVDDIEAEILPENKAEAVKELSQQGKVAMVGESKADEEAVLASHTGFVIGALPSPDAVNADVVLLKNSLLDVSKAIKISKKCTLNIKNSNVLSILFDFLAIFLAAGILVKGFGVFISPAFAVIIMTIFIVCMFVYLWYY